LTGPDGAIHTTASNAFGYYNFEEIAVGHDYILGASAKGQTFNSVVLNVGGEITNANLTGQ
jgi:hypothetical protein